MPNTKLKSIAMILQQRSLNRFEAEKFGDHCLHSTVSELRHKGWTIHDEWERVPNRFGGRLTRVKRYRAIEWPTS